MTSTSRSSQPTSTSANTTFCYPSFTCLDPISLYERTAIERIKAARDQSFSWQQLAKYIETKEKQGSLEQDEEQKIPKTPRPNAKILLSNVQWIKDRSSLAGVKARTWASRWNREISEIENSSEEILQIEVEGALFNTHRRQLQLLSPILQNLNESTEKPQSIVLNQQFSAKTIYLFLHLAYNQNNCFAIKSQEGVKLLKLLDCLDMREEKKVAEKFLSNRLEGIKNSLSIMKHTDDDWVKEWITILLGAQQGQSSELEGECISLLLSSDETLNFFSKSSHFQDSIIELNLSACVLDFEKLERLSQLSMPNLNSLQFPEKCLCLMDSHLELIAKNCPKIRKVILHDCPRVTDVGVRALSDLKLEELRISPMYLAFNSGCNAIAALGESLKNNNSLNMSESVLMTDADLRIVIEKISRDKILSLNISGCTQLSKEGIIWVIQQLPNLIEIDLSQLSAQVDADVIEAFPKTLQKTFLNNCKKIKNLDLRLLSTQCPGLTTLSVNGCSLLTDDFIAFLKDLPLTYLSTACLDNLTDVGLRIFIEEHPQIQHLRLSYSMSITNLTVKNLLKNACTDLKTLALDGIDIDDMDLSTLLLANQMIEELSISYCKRITDQSLSAVGQSCAQLQRIVLCKKDRFDPQIFRDYNSSFTDKGISALAKGCPGLRSFICERNPHITDASLNSLSTHCSKLEEISISNNPNITGKGIQKIATQCSALKIVSLNECSQLGNEVLYHLCYLSHFSWSRATDNQPVIDSKGIQYLIKNCPELKSLSLRKSEISDSDVENALTSLHHLTSLEIPYCYRHKMGGRAFESISKWGRHLRYLNIEDNYHIPNELEKIKLIASYCKALRSFHIGANGIYRETLIHIMSNLLQLVELSNFKSGNIDSEDLPSLPPLPTLRILDLGIVSAQEKHLQSLLEMQTNLRLVLVKNGENDDPRYAFTKTLGTSFPYTVINRRPFDAELP